MAICFFFSFCIHCKNELNSLNRLPYNSYRCYFILLCPFFARECGHTNIIKTLIHSCELSLCLPIRSHGGDASNQRTTQYPILYYCNVHADTPPFANRITRRSGICNRNSMRKPISFSIENWRLSQLCVGVYTDTTNPALPHHHHHHPIIG